MKAIAYFLHFLWSLILFVFYGCIAAALIESCCFLLHLMGLTDGASWNDFFKEAFIVFVMLVGIGVAAVIKEMHHYWTDPEFRSAAQYLGISWADYKKIKDKAREKREIQELIDQNKASTAEE